MPYEKKLIQLKDRRKFWFFSNRKSVRIRMRSLSENKHEEGRGQTFNATVCAVILAFEWVFWSAHYMMMLVTGSNISLP